MLLFFSLFFFLSHVENNDTVFMSKLLENYEAIDQEKSTSKVIVFLLLYYFYSQ